MSVTFTRFGGYFALAGFALTAIGGPDGVPLCSLLGGIALFLWGVTGKTRGPGSWWIDNSLRFLSGVLVGGLVVILAT